MNPKFQTTDEAAAHWVARREAGCSASEELEFERWLAAAAEHAAAYRAMAAAWRRLDRVRGSRVAAELEAELDDWAPRAGGKFLRFPRPAWISAGLAAAAAAVAVVYFAWWRPARLAETFVQTAATDVGQIGQMDLPDGSSVRLNTDTALDVQYSKTERRVRLRHGEALFEIAKNAARPFIVNAGGVDVRAVGTAFAVRVRETAVEVLVTEGRVRVDDAAKGNSLLAAPPPAAPGPVAPPAEPPLLTAGRRVVIATATEALAPADPVAVPTEEIARALAWKERRLVFVSAPLSEMVEEFNRYNRQKLVVADAALAARRFGGTFQADDPATFVQLLQASHDIAVEAREGRTILRQKHEE